MFIDKKRSSISPAFELSEVRRASLNSKGNKMEMRMGYRQFAATRPFSRPTPKACLLFLALALALGTKSFAASGKVLSNPSDQSEVRNAVQRIFNQLKSGEYTALYDSLPSSSRSRISRDRFVNALQRTRDLYQLDRIEIGAVRVAGNLAAVDTVMYARIAKPIEGDGKLVVQQYLVKEDGSWRVATGDRATTERFLKNNPGFARKFPIKRPRAFLKQNGNWIEIPLGAAARPGRP